MTDQAVETPVVETAAAEPTLEASASTAENNVTMVEGAATEETRNEEKATILKQVEFYFSDSNLPQDKFMTELVKKGKDGCMYTWLIVSSGAWQPLVNHAVMSPHSPLFLFLFCHRS
jgi:hypothetical protein